MKSIRFRLVGAATFVLAVAFLVPAQGQDKVPPPPPLPIQPLIQPLNPFGGGELVSAKGLEKLQLTKEQRADFDKLNEEYQKKNKEFMEGLLNLAKDPDPKKTVEFLLAQQRLRPDYLAKVEKLLREEQKKTFEEVRREAPGIGIGPIINPQPPFPVPGFGGPAATGQFLPAATQKKLKLSDEQRQKIDELQKDLEKKVLDLLTDEQKKTLEDLKKQRGFGPGIFPQPFPLDPLPPPKVDLPPPPKTVDPDVKKKD